MHWPGAVPDRQRYPRDRHLPAMPRGLARGLLRRDTHSHPLPFRRRQCRVFARRLPADFLAGLEVVDVARGERVEVADISSGQTSTAIPLDRHAMLLAVHDRRAPWS